MKHLKRFNLFTSLLTVTLMVSVSSLCALFSLNQNVSNSPSINDASDGITANDTSNDPIFYIDQFKVDSLTMPGLGPTYWTSDFGQTHDADLSDGSYTLNDIYGALSIQKKNSSAWKNDGDWQSFNNLVSKNYISDQLSIGVVDNWKNNTATSIKNVGTIYNTQGYNWQHKAVNPNWVTVPVSVPLWMHPIEKITPATSYYGNEQFNNASWENDFILETTEHYNTHVSLYTTLFFNDPTQTSEIPLFWNDIDIKDFIELKYDGITPTLRFTKDWTCWLCLYPRIWAPWYGDDPWGNWHTLVPITYGTFPDFRFHNINNVPYEYKGDYIDIGVIDFVWIQNNTNIVIKNHGGDKTIALNETDFVITKINGELQTGHEWCTILARLELALTLQTSSGAKPIAAPTSDLDYINSEDFDAFHVTYWWWDPYTAPNKILYDGIAGFTFLDAADQERVLGTINIPILTCL